MRGEALCVGSAARPGFATEASLELLDERRFPTGLAYLGYRVARQRIVLTA